MDAMKVNNQFALLIIIVLLLLIIAIFSYNSNQKLSKVHDILVNAKGVEYVQEN